MVEEPWGGARAASAWIEHSDFESLRSVHFAPGIGAAQRDAFFTALASARVRVEKLYGPLHGAPTIVVTDADTRDRYADNGTAVNRASTRQFIDTLRCDDALERELATLLALAP